MAGTYDPTNLPSLPGIYINFVTAAVSLLEGGVRGTVALPLATYANTATAKTVYSVTAATRSDAIAILGEANMRGIDFALRGGAQEVLVYTLPAAPTTTDYADMYAAFDVRQFNVFSFDDVVPAAEQDAALTWAKASHTEGRHFMIVFGGSDADDSTPATGNARTARLDDDYAVNLITGGIVDGVSYNSSVYSPYVAGLIAGTSISDSITYAVVNAEDVTRRLTRSEQTAALAAGSLVLIHDGQKVKVLRGVTTSGSKIRLQRARQAIAEDLERLAADNYIGKLDNNEVGRVELLTAIESYLGELEREGVLTSPKVDLDPNKTNTGDTVYLIISFVPIDSVERIFVTINV